MIETIVFWILTALCASYVIIHAVLRIGISRLTAPKYAGPDHQLSVIVAARNEERSIGPLLDSLTRQEYSQNNFEIIVVNDRSTDNTVSIVESYQRSFSNIRLIDIRENTTDMPDKKNALRTAIDQARFDILVFTDADCIASPQWLRSISDAFTDDTGMSAGFSPYIIGTAPSFLRYEELKNSMLAAAGMGAGIPFMCTGRNFAYRKQVYTEVGGFEKIKHSISGDDDLFLQLVHARTQWKIRYMMSPESVVKTIPPATLSQFIHQRTRHVSASTHYPLTVQTGYALIHLFHLFLFIGFFIIPLPAIVMLMIKFAIDGYFIAHGTNIFNERFSIPEFYFNEVLVVLYSWFIAPLGFISTFQWKGTPSR